MASKFPTGRYKARCLYHTLETNNHDNIQLTITVLPYATLESNNLPPGISPLPIPIYLTLTDATLGTADQPGWVLDTLRFLGFSSADLTSLKPSAEHAHSFTGREIQIMGSEDEYKGKKRIRWNILRYSDEKKEAAEDKLLALSAKHRAVLQTLLPPDDPNTPF